MSYSERYARALGIAARAHRHQTRKGKDVPYVTHPVHVARILDRHGFPEDLVLAGLLHDVLEDTDVTEQELEAAVGAEVVALVRAVTEQKSEDGVERPWEVRKAEQLAQLAAAPRDVLALKAADAIHNARETLDDVQTHGTAVAFSRFKRGPGPSVDYYRKIAAIVDANLPAHPLTAELRSVVDALAVAAHV